MKWIDAGDIKVWVTGKRRHCEEKLPELLRRLISASASTITRLDFPSGDSITTGGWDGHLETPDISPFFPSGVSGWEFGGEPSCGKKADSDYLSRTSKPNGLARAKTTFVFVTPRPFPKRKEWEARKKKQKKWKAVRVIAASELETWLENTPAVALWLARQIGKAPDHIRDIEAAWEEWSLATEPAMIPAVVTAGRAEEVQRVHQWVQGGPSLLEVQGDSPDEALAFLYAALNDLSEPERMRSISRCVVVEDVHQFRTCVQFQQPLIIAAPAHCRIAVGPALKKHHVFLIADSNTLDQSGRLMTLPRPRAGALEAALRQNGRSESEARRLVRDSGASLPVLRRRTMRSTIAAPDWSKAESANLLLPALLAGTWRDEEGDRQMIETLSKRPYAQYIRELEPLLTVADAPLRRIENVWMLKSPLDAWFVLARYLDTEHLTRFRSATTTVLGETDPKYDLDPDQRWAAAVYGKTPRFSGWIQQGLVKSLVLLGVHGVRPGSREGQDTADAITTDILKGATTWQRWSSLKGITPLLAEAAPDAFLDVVLETLATSPAIFVDLMRDEGTTFGECRHAGLLWALEGLAWDPRFLDRAVSALAQLAAIDPGGSWSNRPLNSLRDIFLPSPPQTYAPAPARIAAFDAIATSDPELAWKIVEGLLTGGSLTAAHQFRWRPRAGERDPFDPPSQEDYHEYATAIVPRMKALVAASPANLIGAIKAFVNAPVIRDAVLEALTTTDPKSLPNAERLRLWSGLRDLLHWINGYGGADAKKHADTLARELDRWTPEDPLIAHEWILGNAWPNLPEGDPRDYDAREEAITVTRKRAARDVLDQTTMSEIVAFGTRVDYPGVFGDAFARAVRDEEDDALVDAMVAHTPFNVVMMLGYSNGRVALKGTSWIPTQARRLAKVGIVSPQAIASLYLGAPEGRTTWEEVASYGSEVERAYWQSARGRSREREEDIEIAIHKLIAVDRPDSALEIAGAPKTPVRSESLQLLLRALREFDPKERRIDGTMFRFYLGEVFNKLHQSGLTIDELAALEWPFAQLLADELHSHTKEPLAVHRLLQRDPSFFSMLVGFTYRRDDKQEVRADDTVADEQRKQRTNAAGRIFRSWRLMPGTQADGSIDEGALLDWITRARKQCAESGHVTGCDIQIAEILARSPAGADGAWPHESVRSVIEHLQNRVVDEHFQVAVFNNRGVTTRGVGDGGKQERDLAQRYEGFSQAVGAKWPRTKAILHSIAQSYERYADREDVTAELTDLDWNN